MKTIIFVLLLSLSFAFVPNYYYTETDNLKPVADVMAASALETLEDVKSSDSSDYLVIEIYPDESDWSNVASEIVELFKPIFTNFTEAISEYLSTNNISLEDQLFGNDVLTSIVQLFNATIEEKALFGDAFDRSNLAETDNSKDSAEIDWNNIASEIIELFKPILMNFTEVYSDYRPSSNDDSNLERDILLSIAQYVNETTKGNGVVLEKSSILEANDTRDQSDSDYLLIEIYSDESDSNIEAEIIEFFKPILTNFTEAISEYLSTNNITLDDQLFDNDVLTSIAQLFNETIEEKALFGDALEKNNIVEADNSKDQNQTNFLGL